MHCGVSVLVAFCLNAILENLQMKTRRDCLGMLVQCSIKFSGTHLYTWLEIARLT